MKERLHLKLYFTPADETLGCVCYWPRADETQQIVQVRYGPREDIDKSGAFVQG
jgi:hypothetical protein